MFINGTVKIGKLIACLALLWCMCIPALPGIAQDMHTPSPAHMSADDAESLFLQGKQYHDGRGVSQNYTTARTYYLQAAKLGHNGARLNLGYLYFTGQGVPQSYPTARMWYEQAAAAGDKDAVLNLAMMNQNGLGIPHTIPSTQASPDPLETISSTTSPTDIELMDPESTDTESTDTELMDTDLDVLSPLLSSTRNSSVSHRNIAAQYENIRPASAQAPDIIRLSDFLPKIPTLKSSYTAPVWTGTFLALFMLALACGTALWFTHQFTALRRTLSRRAFAKAFYAQHRESLRGNYVRLPENQRSCGNIKDSWAVNLSTRMVRFAMDRHQNTDIKCMHSKRIVDHLKTNPYTARQYIYPLLAHIQSKILSDVQCTDNGTMTPKTPIQYAHEPRSVKREKRLQYLPVPHQTHMHSISKHARSGSTSQPQSRPDYLKLVPTPALPLSEADN